MATSVVTQVEITNISGQTIKVHVQRDQTASLLPNGGELSIHSKTKATVAEPRLDMQQLTNMRKKGVITFFKYDVATNLDITA
jgi:hypothetical protein